MRERRKDEPFRFFYVCYCSIMQVTYLKTLILCSWMCFNILVLEYFEWICFWTLFEEIRDWWILIIILLFKIIIIIIIFILYNLDSYLVWLQEVMIFFPLMDAEFLFMVYFNYTFNFLTFVYYLFYFYF